MEGAGREPAPAGVSYPERELRYRPGARARLYNILVIVLDDLRTDLRTLGYARDTMPLLEARLGGATVFTHCHTPVGWTLPACASIVTGLPPEEHGIHTHNQKFLCPKLGHYLGDGYFRVGITNNGNLVSDRISGEQLQRIGRTRRDKKWSLFGWDDGFDYYSWTHREDHKTPFRVAGDFLRTRAGAPPGLPYFLFFHSNIVHDYHRGEPYYLEVQAWLREEFPAPLRSFPDGPAVWRDPSIPLPAAERKRFIKAKYDAGIRFADRQVEGLLERVDFENTVVVLTSDHGEGFDPDLGRVHHCGRLHQDLLRVPLVVWLPAPLRTRCRAPQRENRCCSTLDIVPTVLRLLGDEVRGFPGRFLFDLEPHRILEGCDRGYVFFEQDGVRTSYDEADVELRSALQYPLKRISVRRDEAQKEYVYNLAYDPGERDNLLAAPRAAIANFEPITFVVAVNDAEELRHNFLASPVCTSSRHELLLMENYGNRPFASMSALCCSALERAANDLVFFVHQDVFLPPGWERRFFLSLGLLEARDPGWGVLGAAGVPPYAEGAKKTVYGHWCDPHAYTRSGQLPMELAVLDELWLGIRRRHGLGFDPRMPGWHCYGMDLSLTMREHGRKSYAVDAFVWHKYRDRAGRPVGRAADCAKIAERQGEAFSREFARSRDYVAEKWEKYLPLYLTCRDEALRKGCGNAGAAEPPVRPR